MMTANNETERRLLEYFETNASEDLKARTKASGKTIQGALRFITKWAKEEAKGASSFCATDEAVFGQLMHYFEEDSISSEKGAVNGPTTDQKNKTTATPATSEEPEQQEQEQEQEQEQDIDMDFRDVMGLGEDEPPLPKPKPKPTEDPLKQLELW